MFNKLLITLLLFACIHTNAKAQDDFDNIKKVEDTLVVLSDSMYHAFIPDERPEYVRKFVRKLIMALKMPHSWKYDFPKLSEEINIIYDEDKSFRIFNWGIAPTQVTRRYYGAMQMAGDELILHPLVDYSTKLKKCSEDSVLTGGKWYGGIIYKIMKSELDGENIYTLFTKNSSSAISNKKVLDPMTITENGVVFGAPIFSVKSKCRPEESINRFIIEYKKEVSASMNWDADFNAIFFDRLASQVNDPHRKYTYVPTGQYDGFKWKNGEWRFVKDLIPIENRKDGEAPKPTPIFNDKE